jgi:predicted RNA binding protein YcfA (HicA-like mRNA interferase family)
MIEGLRSLPVRKLVQALEREGCVFRRVKGSQRLDRHPDGRRVVLHYHHGRDTLPIGTLKQIIEAARWTQEDLHRLGLIE